MVRGYSGVAGTVLAVGENNGIMMIAVSPG